MSISSRRALSLTVLTACSGALSPAHAGAGATARSRAAAGLRITPSSPLSSTSIVAKWRAGLARTRGRKYGVDLRIAAPEGSLCTATRTLTIRRSWNKDDTLTFRLRANDMTLGGESLWCPGKATLRVFSTKAGTRRATHAALRFRIREDPDNPVPKGIPVEAEILEGSQLTVQVPGRADRASSLSGRLTGHLPGPADPAADVSIDLTGGGLVVESLAPDPLCTANGRSGANRADLAASGSRGTIFKDGRFTMRLRLDEDPIGLTGCQGPGGAPAGRSVEITGRGAPDAGLTRIEASGAFSGVTYSEGAQARIVVALVLAFDLSPQ